MLYTINFSIETKSNQLQKVCDELVADLQAYPNQSEPIQLNQYPLDQDEDNVCIEAEIINLNKDTLDYLIKRIKSGDFDPEFQEYSCFGQSFGYANAEKKTMDCF